MSRLFVALCATALALNSVAAQADEGDKNVVRDSPQDTATKKAVEDAKAKKALQPLPTTKSRAVGDFPPYGGKTVDQWRQEEKRRQERLEQTRPKSADEERAERKRLVDEWEKTQRPEPK